MHSSKFLSGDDCIIITFFYTKVMDGGGVGGLLFVAFHSFAYSYSNPFALKCCGVSHDKVVSVSLPLL